MMIKLINHNVEGEFWISLDPPFQDIITIGHEQGFWKLLWEELKYFSVPPSQRRKTLDVGVRNTEYREWILHFEGSPVYPSLSRNPESYVEVIVTEEELNMETKTIKLINHNLRGEFYLQISGEVAERLIAEGKEKGYWSTLYSYFKKNLYTWDRGENERASYFLGIIKFLCTSGDFIVWATEVLTDCWLFREGEPVFVQGVVEEIVT